MVQWEVPPLRRIAFVGVLALAACSVLVTVLSHDFRLGGYLLAVALGTAAGLRAFLPEKYCLGLLVRSRRVDVAVNAALAVAVFVGARIVPA